MTSIDTSVHASPAEATPYRWRWAALFVILAAEVMDLLDAMVTNIASPAIRAELGGSAAVIQWLGAAYTLSMAVGLLTGGRLGDIFGRKRMFVIGAVGFTAGSLLCGLAQGPETLIAARVVQGLFGAVMIPQGLGMIKEMFPPKEMQKAFGLFGPIMGLSTVAGPILAGWLVDADFFGTGWRMIFLINLPLGLAAVLAGMRYLPESRSPHPLKLDVPGVFLASLAGVLIIYPLVQGREHDWPAWSFLMIGAAVVVFALFGWFQGRKSRNGGDPLVVPSLFRKRAFTGGLVTGIVFFSGMVGFSLVFNLYVQIGLGYSTLKAGLSMMPWSIGLVIGFICSQPLQKFGRKLLQGGALLMALGVIGIIVTLNIAGVGVTPWQLTPALLLTGVGMGLLMAPFFDIVLAGVEPHETGSASGSLTAVQQLGSAFGVALLGTLFFGMLGTNVAAASDDVTPRLRADLAAVQVTGPAQDRLVEGLRACGHDRAVAKDQAEAPASCVRLEADARAAAASPQAGQAVGKALETAGTTAAKEGFSQAMKAILWVVDGMLLLTFLVAFLLPRHAREGDAAGH
ncbi:putative actinorhodin transporter [Sphaerisporangium krabiense]|uniref:EmrB/QacA subfamily drug resistance transporter n=1 Tax=Sphaerisporangium krabiense TaxID=763782 RepID=A0A7W9DR93_9ACTN|nr:MFS transporter [Sphaerisporangium krabiense]MBB5627834.1 EmrB/QacA subfamily drug resistance transporter [Sphaerisporangium krabiense]GII61993.1 putative actinorhodin transporter [Sphaerisporangium krabiense]